MVRICITDEQGFKRFVEAGRVAYINFGEDHGKICVIADVINNNRVLVDGPTLGVARQVISLRRIALTDFVVKVPKGAKTRTIQYLIEILIYRAAISEFGLIKKWGETKWGNKVATHAKRSKLNDFERFQVMVLKRQV